MSALHFPFAQPPAEGQATEVAPGILWMRLPLPMALDHVNVYALDDGDAWTLIDTGMHSRRSIAIWETLLAGPLAAKLDEQPVPTPESLTFYRRAGLTAEMLAQRAKERPFNFCDVVSPMPLGFDRLSEGGLIHMGGRTWAIHLGSGHAPDHATFWSEDLVIGGDQLLPGISANIGVYPTEPECDPLTDWIDSCTRFVPMAQDRHLVLPGHKLPFTGLPLRLTQMIENHHSALERLFEHLSQPRRATECFAPLFKRAIGPNEFGLALVEAVAHLNHLLQHGRVSRHLSPDGAWIWQRGRE